MDSTTTSTSDSSSDYTSDSSEDGSMETAEIYGNKLQLPQGLCERRDMFLSVFSKETWNSLSDNNKRHLQNFLPKFPENDDKEKNRTLQRLFNCESFRFGSPLLKFHEELKAGYFRPDIANMRKIIRKAQKKEAMYRYKKFREKQKQDILDSQRKLVNQVNNLPPGVEPKLEKKYDFNINSVVHRAKRRYFQILNAIQTKTDNSSYCSPDENYPEGPPLPLSRKQRRHLNSIRNSHNNEIFYSTISSRTTGIDLEKYVSPSRNPFYITDESYKNMLMEHKRRRLELSETPEYNIAGLSLADIVNRTQLPYSKALSSAQKSSAARRRKKELSQVNRPFIHSFSNYHSSNSETDSDSIVENRTNHRKPPSRPTKTLKKKQENKIEQKVPLKPLPPLVTTTSTTKTYTPMTISDLEGIDMMEIPIDLENSEIDIMELNNKPELMQETHSNFLSLIRDVICSTSDHRMGIGTLEERLKTWQENPISPLNDWYSLSDNWALLLGSALSFLCGNSVEQPDDFVPYIEYKPSLDQYQWIGAGRDSDQLLTVLCQYWLDHRDGGANGGETSLNSNLIPINVNVEKKDELVEVEVSDRSQTPPPPRCPTNWSVRKATSEEVKEFRVQERRRYDNPHKAFTYRCHGYESVVGPLKGIYSASAGNTKARGHTMLNADRPNFVTILSLVRDATARLPNGEGTRADICELLKSSQYISPTAPDNILQSVVSGALDRMHTQFDPCVKYDPKRKIWLYLHRNRSEEDFERIHQQYQGVNRSGKKVGITSTSKKVGGGKGSKTKIEKGKNKCEEKKVTKEKEEIEMNDALQTIVQPPALTPTKPTKNVLKIITPTQAGKSLIIPTNQMPALKSPPIEVSPSPVKQISQSQLVTQHLLQTIQAKHKNAAIVTQPKLEEKLEGKNQQFVHSLTTQQLQNIKNVTLVRGVAQTQVETSKLSSTVLTPAQQQQILQSIKQKIMPQQQQQIIVKQKSGLTKVVTASTTATVQAKVIDGSKSILSSGQTPVVAKVLTNAAGQVISVESLLAHQKQHGSLPQGTTLRVAGSKTGVTPNIIQLSAPSKNHTGIATHFSVATTQNNIIISNTQPKLISTVTTSTSTANLVGNPPLRATAPRIVTATASKPSPKVTQQLINAKLIQTPEGAKLVQPKLLVSSGTTKTGVGALTANPNTIRMVNTSNLNLTHIAGKPVLISGNTSGKTATLQSRNVILQQQTMLGGQQVVLKTAGGGGAGSTSQNHLVLQQHGGGTSSVSASGQTTSGQRVVLATSQGQAGQGQILAQQILLPAGFQGHTFNIKALQGVKVIPLAQTQARGVQGRQVFARVMNPTIVKATATQQQSQSEKPPDSIITTSD